MLSTPRYKPVRLIPFLMLSVLLHGALIMALPDLTRLFNIHIKSLALLATTEIEVMLVDPETEPEPPAEKKRSALLADDHISSLIDHFLIESPALGDAPLSPPALVELPKIYPPLKSDLETLPLAQTQVKIAPQELLGNLGRKPAGRLRGVRLGGAYEKPVAESGVLVDELLSPGAQNSLLALDTPEKNLPNQDFGLSGPVAQSRQVLFRPELPKISLARDVSVDFRFWVRPDGSVSRIETLKIGDLELVNVAERFLQQWRFSLLPAEVAQREQWGTVSIVFRVSR